jgi:hypothetical protein
MAVRERLVISSPGPHACRSLSGAESNRGQGLGAAVGERVEGYGAGVPGRAGGGDRAIRRSSRDVLTTLPQSRARRHGDDDELRDRLSDSAAHSGRFPAERLNTWLWGLAEALGPRRLLSSAAWRAGPVVAAPLPASPQPTPRSRVASATRSMASAKAAVRRSVPRSWAVRMTALYAVSMVTRSSSSTR